MRITHSMLSSQLIARLQDGQSRLVQAQNQVSSGRRIQRVSDDPLAAARSMRHRDALSSLDQLNQNIDLGSARLSFASSTVAEVEALLVRARDIALAGSNDTQDPTSLTALAEETRALADRLEDLLLERFGGEYIFTGSSRGSAPLERLGPGRVEWLSGEEPVEIATGPHGGRTRIDVSARSVAAGSVAELRGDDLDPNLSSATPLSDLRDGAGIAAGSIHLTNRAGQYAEIDLTEASDLQEVIDAIEGAPLNIRAEVRADGRGIDLIDESVPVSADSKLIVEEVDKGTTASDLGIWDPAGRTDGHIVGDDLQARLTRDTPVDLLRKGQGLDYGDVWVEVGSSKALVDLREVETMGDVLDRFADAGLDLNAQLDGDRLVLSAQGHGTPLTLYDAPGGRAAVDLGIEGGAADRDAFALLDALAAGLESESPDAVHALLDGFESAVDAALAVRTDLGGRISELDLARLRHLDLSLELEDAISGLEDVDYAQAVIELTSSQNVYEAALATTQTVLSLGLIKYL